MADPFGFLHESARGHPTAGRSKAEAPLVIKQDPLFYAAYLISKHNLSVWYEPDWGLARRLALWFPRCAVFSIPHESRTETLTREPGWRPRRDNNAQV